MTNLLEKVNSIIQKKPVLNEEEKAMTMLARIKAMIAYSKNGHKTMSGQQADKINIAPKIKTVREDIAQGADRVAEFKKAEKKRIADSKKEDKNGDVAARYGRTIKTKATAVIGARISDIGTGS